MKRTLNILLGLLAFGSVFLAAPFRGFPTGHSQNDRLALRKSMASNPKSSR